MSQNSFPDNVPDATKGASDSVAAPGCVGVGGTKRFLIFLALIGFFAFEIWLVITHPVWALIGLVVLVLICLAWSISGEIEKRV